MTADLEAYKVLASEVAEPPLHISSRDHMRVYHAFSRRGSPTQTGELNHYWLGWYATQEEADAIIAANLLDDPALVRELQRILRSRVDQERLWRLVHESKSE